MSANAIITRHLLTAVHAEVRAAFPDIPNVVAAAGVTRTLRDQWFAEIITPGRPRFTWNGRAYNATEARAKAWRQFIEKHGPADSRPCDTED